MQHQAIGRNTCPARYMNIIKIPRKTRPPFLVEIVENSPETNIAERISSS